MAEQAQVGDTVRLTIEGEVYEGDNGWLHVRGWGVNRSDGTVEILSRATPPLPSEPGTWWLDRYDDVWHVSDGGTLRRIGDETDIPDRVGPFRPLILGEIK